MNLIKMNDTSQHMYPQFFPVMQYFTYIKISFKISRQKLKICWSNTTSLIIK